MIKKISPVILICTFAVAGCLSVRKSAKAGNPSTPVADSVMLSQRQLLKEYALCQCIYHAYDKMGMDSVESSLSIYHENLLYSYESEMAIDSIAAFVSRSVEAPNSGDYKGRRAVLFTCTQFYKSRYLDSIILSLDSKIAR